MGLVTRNLMSLRHSQVSVALSLRGITEKLRVWGQETHKVFFCTNRRHPTRSMLSLVKKGQQAVTKNYHITIVKVFLYSLCLSRVKFLLETSMAATFWI